MKKSKLNTYKICWVSEQVDTPNPIIADNHAIAIILPLQVVMGVGHVLVVLISIDTHSHSLVMKVRMIPPHIEIVLQ